MTLGTECDTKREQERERNTVTGDRTDFYTSDCGNTRATPDTVTMSQAKDGGVSKSSW